MNGTGYTLTAGVCWGCNRLFTFNHQLVPSLPVDLDTDLPADLGGNPAKCVKVPICATCVEAANVVRAEAGRPLIEVLPGAYDPEPTL